MAGNDVQPDKKQAPKIGVVIGYGGIKCNASIPLFEFLDEAGIEVDLLFLCSGGATTGALWATGTTGRGLREAAKAFWVRKLFSNINYRTLLSIAGLPFGRFDQSRGLLHPDTIRASYNSAYGDHRIEDITPRLMIQATDALNGEPVTLTRGLLREAVYASAAMFPVLPAVEIDGRWLIDGAYSSPLPVLEAVKEGMDIIISMSFEERSSQDMKGFVGSYMRAAGYTHKWLQRVQTALSLDLHHNEIIMINVVFNKSIGLRSVHLLPEIIEAGEQAVAREKEYILAAIKNFNA
ncbi:MAG: patatin [Rhodospirillaceae bacterium]|nr:patatin [Rhodospirillaceae bacterium]